MNTNELPPCPFCGEIPDGFGQTLSRDGLYATKTVRHPETGGCPLDILVFRVEDWNTRAPVACNCQSSTNESQISSCAPVAGLTEEDVRRIIDDFTGPIGESFDRAGYDDGAEYAALELKERLLAALSKKANA